VTQYLNTGTNTFTTAPTDSLAIPATDGSYVLENETGGPLELSMSGNDTIVMSNNPVGQTMLSVPAGTHLFAFRQTINGTPFIIGLSTPPLLWS
jgi:hypothetical protein